MDKLSDVKLRHLATPGKHFDGGGLYLEVTPAGGRYFRMKYRFAGKEKRLAFGEIANRRPQQRLADVLRLERVAGGPVVVARLDRQAGQ